VLLLQECRHAPARDQAYEKKSFGCNHGDTGYSGNLRRRAALT